MSLDSSKRLRICFLALLIISVFLSGVSVGLMIEAILLSHKLGLGVRINIAIIGFGLGVVGLGCCGVGSYIQLRSV